MDFAEPATQTVPQTGRRPLLDANEKLHNRERHVAQAVWVVLAAMALMLLVVNIPAYYTFLHLPAPAGGVEPGHVQIEQLSPAGLRSLQSLGVSVDFYAFYRIMVSALYVLGFLGVSALLIWRKPTSRLALLTSFALLAFPFGNTYQSVPLPAAQVLTIQALGHFGGVCLALVFYLFPDGRFVPSWPWARWLVACWVIREGLLFYSELAGGSVAPASWLAVVLTANKDWVLPLLLVTLVGAQAYRYRHVSQPLQRQQTKWVVFGLACTGVGIIVLIFLLSAFARLFEPGTLLYFVLCAVFDAVLLCVPVSLGIAILRYRLWDIDFLINRTLVYGVLTTGTVGLYVLTVGFLGALLQARGSLMVSVLATGLVAVLFQPLRERMQHGVNRLMYGERDTPYTVLARLGERLETSLAAQTMLPTIVETLSQAMKLPYVAIKLKQGAELALAASYGQAGQSVLRWPLVYQRELVGELLLSPRRPDEPLSPADRRLLDDLSRQVGVVAHSIQISKELTRLTSELQQARQSLVAAREEERRRLRRDLHDGLGPQLSSQTLLLTAAQMMLPQEPQEAAAILESAVAQAQAAVADVRRLVYGLRPPALDDLGLVATLQEQLAHNRASGIEFTLDAPEPLPPLPAAVEVACYRIVQEAVTNVVRHAHARRCTVRLAYGEQLTVAVSDDGLGLPPAYRAGVGLTSMRERAEELGGSWQIITQPGGGTTVEARLPYR